MKKALEGVILWRGINCLECYKESKTIGCCLWENNVTQGIKVVFFNASCNIKLTSCAKRIEKGTKRSYRFYNGITGERIK